MFPSLVKGLKGTAVQYFYWGDPCIKGKLCLQEIPSLEVLSLWDSLCCSTLRVLGWRHCKKSVPRASSYERTYTNQISMVCKRHATFFLEEIDSVNSKTPTLPTYNESSKDHTQRSQGLQVQENHLTQTPSNSLFSRKTVFRRQCLPSRLRVSRHRSANVRNLEFPSGTLGHAKLFSFMWDLL